MVSQENKLNFHDQEKEERIKRAIKAYEERGATFTTDISKARQSKNRDNNYLQFIINNLQFWGQPPINIQELKVLDLGCGSDLDPDGNILEKDYLPYFCAYLAALGAEAVVGVDLGSKSPDIDDVYTHVQLKLSTDKSFSLVEELKKRGVGTFNLITASAFLNSPSLGYSKITMKQRILDWAEQLLDEGGYVFFDGHDSYVLEGGQIKKLRKTTEGNVNG